MQFFVLMNNFKIDISIISLLDKTITIYELNSGVCKVKSTEHEITGGIFKDWYVLEMIEY